MNRQSPLIVGILALIVAVLLNVFAAATEPEKGELILELPILSGTKPLPKNPLGILTVVPDGDDFRYLIDGRRRDFHQIRAQAYEAVLRHQNADKATHSSDPPSWVIRIDHRLPIFVATRAIYQLEAAGVKTLWIAGNALEAGGSSTENVGVHWELRRSNDLPILVDLKPDGVARMNGADFDTHDSMEKPQLSRKLRELREGLAAGVVLIRTSNNLTSKDLLQTLASVRATGFSVSSELEEPLQRELDLPETKRLRWEPEESRSRKTIRWLELAQNADGSWGEKHRVGLTGLVLLSFLSRGEIPEGSPWGGSVSMAVRWLITHGEKSSGWLCQADPTSNAGSIEHGIATWALGEYYTMTRDESVVPVLQNAIARIVSGQSARGGWAAGFDAKKPEQLEITVWQMLALYSTQPTKLNEAAVEAAIVKVRTFLTVRRDKDGVGDARLRTHFESSAVGTLCALLSGTTRESIREQRRSHAKQTEGAHPFKYEAPVIDLTDAMFRTYGELQIGGEDWRLWNARFQDELVAHQNADGSWPPTGNKAPDMFSGDDRDAVIWRTGRCLLMLTAFYRYLPTLNAERVR